MNAVKISPDMNFSEVILSLQPTFCIAEGGGFENRLPGGNAEKK